jgi:2-dehydro-3-deoxyphosphooctonate aldolase (KDO 8-P synthase)
MRIIAGPCQYESLQQSEDIAAYCKEVCDSYDINYIFKASYDKANRTSIGTQRGIGLDSTMEGFRCLKQWNPALQILTDVHTVEQVKQISDQYHDAVDVLQIPAFLSRQTDLITAACLSGKTVNIKKGQFMAPWDVKGILSKTTGAKDVWITERGTSFGYNTLVVDFTGVRYMLQNYSADIVMDCTHAVQRPGGNGGSSGGNRDYAPYMAYAAAAVGVENFFLEVHPDPDNAPSDGPNMIKLKDFECVVERIVNISYEALKYEAR